MSKTPRPTVLPSLMKALGDSCAAAAVAEKAKFEALTAAILAESRRSSADKPALSDSLAHLTGETE